MPNLILLLIGAALGAIASYLVLRNNPRHRAKLDAATDKAEAQAKAAAAQAKLKIDQLTD